MQGELLLTNSKDWCKPLNLWFMLSVFLFGINFLLYSFFKIDNMLYIRIAAVLMLFFSIIQNTKSTIKIRSVLLIVFTCYMLIVVEGLLGGICGLNVIIVMSICFLQSKNMNINGQIKYLAYVCVILTIVVLVCLFIGVVKNEDVSVGDRIRHSLGFVNVNAASLFFVSTAFVWLLAIQKLKWYHCAVSIMYVYLIYRETNSRTPLMMIVLFWALYAVFYLDRKRKMLLFPLESGIIVLFASVFFWPILYRVFPGLDDFLSLRLTVFNNYIKENGIACILFGGSVVGEIDNFYLLLFYTGGLIVYISFFYVISYVVAKVYRQNDNSKCAYIVTFLVAGLMESMLLRIEILSTIVFWLLVGYFYFEKDIKVANVKIRHTV